MKCWVFIGEINIQKVIDFNIIKTEKKFNENNNRSRCTSTVY